MSLTDEFVDWMPSEITWEPRTGVDLHGAASYGAAQTLQCRVVYQQKLVLDDKGQQRMSNVTVYLKDAPGVAIRDRITLPAGLVPATPQLLTVARQQDDTGAMVEILYA